MNPSAPNATFDDSDDAAPRPLDAGDAMEAPEAHEPVPAMAPVPAQAPVAAFTPVQSIHFCRDCGAAWDASWDACARCASRPPRAPADQLDIGSDKRLIGGSIVLYFALLGVSIITIITVLVSKTPLTLTGELVEVSTMSLITVIWCWRIGSMIAPILQTPSRAVWYVVAIGCAIGTFAVSSATVTGMSRVLGVKELKYLESYTAEGFGLWLGVLLICVQPAVFEELAFRGFMYSALGRVLSARETMFVSAGLFAILHLSIPSIPHLFLIGVVLAWLRGRTGSLYPGMLMHFTHNFLTILAERHGSVLPW